MSSSTSSSNRRESAARWLMGCCAALMALVAVNWLITASLPWWWGDRRLATKMEHWLEHRDTYGVVFVGSSYTYRHVAPRVVDHELQRRGIEARSFNLAIDGMHLPQSSRVVEALLDTPSSLDMVVVELGRFVSAVDLEIDRTLEGNYWRTPALTGHMIGFLSGRRDKSLPQKLYQSARLLLLQAQASLHVGHGVGLVEQLIGVTEPTVLGPGGDGFYAVDHQALATTGRPLANAFLRDPAAAQILDRRRQSSLDAFMAPVGPPNGYGARVLQRLIEHAEERGVHLVFLVPPRIGERYATARALLADLPDANKILDLADPRSGGDYFRLDEAADATHLSAAGAERYSLELAGFLAERWRP